MVHWMDIRLRPKFRPMAWLDHQYGRVVEAFAHIQYFVPKNYARIHVILYIKKTYTHRFGDATFVVISEYGLYVSEYAFTDLAAPSTYTLSITCTETRVITTTTEASTGTVTIYVTDNLAPSITNLDGK